MRTALTCLLVPILLLVRPEDQRGGVVHHLLSAPAENPVADQTLPKNERILSGFEEQTSNGVPDLCAETLSYACRHMKCSISVLHCPSPASAAGLTIVRNSLSCCLLAFRPCLPRGRRSQDTDSVRAVDGELPLSIRKMRPAIPTSQHQRACPPVLWHRRGRRPLRLACRGGNGSTGLGIAWLKVRPGATCRKARSRPPRSPLWVPLGRWACLRRKANERYREMTGSPVSPRPFLPTI